MKIVIAYCWIVYRHGIVAKLTFAAVFTMAEDLAYYLRDRPKKFIFSQKGS